MAVSKISEQNFPQSRPAAAKANGLRLSRAARFWLVLLLFIVCTVVAFKQPLHPDPYHAAAFPSLDWLLYPREENAHRRLPEIQCDLNAIYALRGTEKVWVVGNRGLIARSDDGGRSWVKQNLSIAATTAGTPATPTPTTPRPATTGRDFLRIPNLLPVAHAAQTERRQQPPQTDEAGKSGKGSDPRSSNPPLQYDRSEDEKRKRKILEDEKRRRDNASRSSQRAAGAGRGVNVNRNASSGVTNSPRQATPGRESSTASNNNEPQSNPALTPNPQASPQTSATPGATNAEEDLIAVHFYHERNGWVVGRSGARFRTSDGGTHGESRTASARQATAADFNPPEKSLTAAGSGRLIPKARCTSTPSRRKSLVTGLKSATYPSIWGMPQRSARAARCATAQKDRRLLVGQRSMF